MVEGTKINCDGFQIDKENIQEEDMPNEVLREVYGICGREVAISLCQFQRGVAIQVPSQPWNKVRNRLIREMFKGTTASIREIARQFGLAECRVRDILMKHQK